ncbi:regulatory protein MarR (plasmid) [Deinococcus proteolyticus MRP]|uniref:Regulatory protein MarR n=1 Tax=Deinococcus proteolyticus (strain ATCC 35074 / DSM 20540 / JCM 6276 / NBRC 101906 / NCIMB 13154 / VKM Ac-1939 / CCM 2703 / MRP) TaxID=693977 RepID=F0RPZ9_DEIPM|nr:MULTISPECIES: MarR family transcriptional regulator [Deinococcus]ADY27201.1 regulatory protein MarR [Deinococcus proteolyticus MRP]MCY1704071.1 MarR family transcriptional regulator [Deinococcus sp. SL84]
MTLYEELLQNTKYSEVSEEAVVSLMRTYAVVMADFDQFVRQFGITPAQYNILRILSGAERAGEQLGRNEIRRRLIDRVSPDVSRMLTRLEKAGLVSRDRRRREGEDQRLVPVQITAQGLELLARVEGPLAERNMHSMAALTTAEQLQLIGLLERIRKGIRALPQTRGGVPTTDIAGDTADGAPE